MALTACSKEIVYRVPPLNEADQARLSCAGYPEIRDVLLALPEHVFLAGSDGTPVVTPDNRKWVAFDVANRREAAVIRFGDIAARGAHFECRDDLRWIADLITDLQD